TVTDAVEVVFLTGPPAPGLPIIPTQYIDGGDTLLVTNTATTSDPNAVLAYQLVNPPANAVIDTNGIITWPTTTNIAPATVTMMTIVTDTTIGLSATNSFQVVVQVPIDNGVPQTNTVAPNSIYWFVVHVPTNA